ncbi:OLC1v1010380C1 [Oldenlandia corymbosa var. corymbosa]|uniref:OLC1v1010380C1 n=1 Tax=Oldenlandia corymbosa var. corymbosa TaxID=529605 RepID=A0AAV1DTQ2_OLDCO|nr:OLC1v1010380C1 [Oldenlandia corymbosa var. corymbosa]
MASNAWSLLNTPSANNNIPSSTTTSFFLLFNTHSTPKTLPAAGGGRTPPLPRVARKNRSSYPAISCVSTPPRQKEEAKTNINHTHKLLPNTTPPPEHKKAAAAPNSCPLTPVGFLERAAVVYGDCSSIVYNETTYKWSETYTRCLKLASAISSLGIKKGDVVSVVAPNIPAMYELHFAVPMTNAILNTVNLRLDARTISILLQHCESKLVFVDHQSTSVILDAISQFPPDSQKPILVLVTESHHHIHNNNNNPNGACFHRETYEEMIEKGSQDFVWLQPEDEWEPMTLNYTSGTTSSPKGVLHSHRALFVHTVDALLDWPLPKNSTYLWTLPMFHANGWSYTWGTAAVGATNVCLRRVDAPSVFEAIGKHKVTHMCGAPAVLNMLSNFPARSHEKLERPVHVLTAGAPPPAAVLARTEAMGFVVSHGYGLTETAGLMVTCAWKEEWNSLPALGRAKLKARQGVRTAGSAGADVLCPETGKSVERDGSTMGEIVLKGGAVMLSYLKDPEATARCMKNGWFYTGDVGVMHPDGYLEVRDRSKDVIICGGENLSSVEVESVLYTHPAVNEAAVVARPDKFWGETPCAFVSLKAEAEVKPSEKDVREFCKARLPLYMVPRTVVFKEELPKTSTGKIQKFLLRDMAKWL